MCAAQLLIRKGFSVSQLLALCLPLESSCISGIFFHLSAIASLIYI